MTSKPGHSVQSRIGRLPAIAVAVAAIAVLTLAGCGGAAPSGACGLGGTADETAFGRSFASMALGDAAGKPGTVDSDAGVVYGAADHVVVLVQATAVTEARLCVGARDSSGNVVADRTLSLAVGAGQVDLGTFSARAYVVRVGVGGVLVRNLPFTIR